jgi:16S rRNA (cytidine1402-2'-O)-methyltransferase
MTGKLFIVPTPIGNLEDITLRAIRILKQVAFIGAEDTRHSQTFLQKYEIKTPLISYHKFNERERVSLITNKLKNGEDGAIISDAGTPGISDPALLIVKACIEENIPIETLPGATAFVPALINSGMNTERFYFVGFLPRKTTLQRDLLKQLQYIVDTLIFYEAPHRLKSFLLLLFEFYGNRNISIAREISKLHETYYRSKLQQILFDFENIILKGEFVILVEGYKLEKLSDIRIKEIVNNLIIKGLTKKEIIAFMKENYQLPKNEIYQLLLKNEND